MTSQSKVTFSLDRDTPVPLHYQLRTQLKEAIKSGALRTGDILPSEPQLAQMAGVSRATVRQGIEELVREGLLRRHRGHGTFVSTPPLRAGGYDNGAATALQSRPSGAVARVTRLSQEPLGETAAGALGLDPAMSAAVIVRLWSQDDEPALLETIWLPGIEVGDVMSAAGSDRALYEQIEQVTSRAIGRADVTVRATFLPDDVAQTLRVGEQTIGFATERRTYTGDDAVEYRQTFVSGARFSFHMTLGRAQLLES